jgi:hypothetical protein
MGARRRCSSPATARPSIHGVQAKEVADPGTDLPPSFERHPAAATEKLRAGDGVEDRAVAERLPVHGIGAMEQRFVRVRLAGLAAGWCNKARSPGRRARIGRDARSTPPDARPSPESRSARRRTGLSLGHLETAALQQGQFFLRLGAGQVLAQASAGKGFARLRFDQAGSKKRPSPRRS